MKPTHIKKATLVLFVGTISYLMAVFSYLSPPVVALDVMRELGLNPDTLSLMFAATMVSYGLMQPFSGFWADRFGPRRCLIAATVLLGLGSLIFSQATGLWSGLVSRLMLGLAAGLTFMPCMNLAGNWFSPRLFGLVASAIIALSALGNSLAGRPLALAVEHFGWRFTFGAVGLIGLVWSVFILTIVFDRPQEAPADQPAATPTLDLRPPKPEFLTTARTILKIPSFWIFGFLYAGTDIIYCAFNALWVGPYLMEVYHQSEAVVGNMISLSAVSYFIGPPLFALWGEAWSYAKVILVVAIFNVGLGLFLVISPPVSGVGVLYALCFFAPVGAQTAAMVLTLGRDLVPSHMGGSIMGFLNLFPIIMGAIMQKIIGRLLTVDPTDQGAIASTRELYGQAFWPMFIFILFTVGLAIWVVRRARRV